MSLFTQEKAYWILSQNVKFCLITVDVTEGVYNRIAELHEKNWLMILFDIHSGT